MVLISGNGYQGVEKRKYIEPPKLKFTTSEWMKLIGGAIVVIATSVYIWTSTKLEIKAYGEDIAEAKECIKKNDAVDVKQTADILTLQNNVKDIKEDVEKLVSYRDEDVKLLHEILGELKSK